MESVTSPLVLPSPGDRASLASRRLWIINSILLGGLWLLVFNQQRLEWSVNPTYAYGWAVPALAAYLFWERWRTRPAGRPPGQSIWLILPALLVLGYMPLRIIQEANPDWVKVNWSIEALAIGVSLSAVYAMGGWRYLFFFAFPLFFCYTALPWPVWIEDTLTKDLMKTNTAICADVLTLCGEPAMAMGNIIQIGKSWVNVEEACSGIRSLQTAFMMALFFGEYHRLNVLVRAILLVSSFAVAFVLNLGRTMLLTHLSGVGGHELGEKWHDTVGGAVMVFCLIALWLLAEGFHRLQWNAPKPVSPQAAAWRAPFPFAYAAVGIGWLVASEVVTVGWYDIHERATPPLGAWHAAWPEHLHSFEVGSFPDRSRALLKFNEGTTGSWTTPEGYVWSSYYLRWNPGRVSKFLAESHYPTVCLPATGLTLVAETGVFVCTVNGVTLPFRTYIFDQSGRRVYVYHAIVEDVPLHGAAPLAYYMASSEERIQSVLRGERNRGQRVLGISLVGPTNSDDARAAVVKMLHDVVVPSAPLTSS